MILGKIPFAAPPSIRELARGKAWMWQDVALPMLATRIGLLLVGWFSQALAVDPRYPWKIIPYTSHYLLNIWARWDSATYLRIAKVGYSVTNPRWATSIAFFPLYPYLVKYLALLVPEPWRKDSAYLVIGVLLSNLLLLAALLLLHKLITLIEPDVTIAQRVILYMMFYPTSFYFSAFYTESLYLFLSVGAFYAAHKKIWWLAGVFGFLSALSRPVGVLVFIPLAWLYFESVDFKLLRVRPESGWLLLVPAGLFTFAASISTLTNNIFSIFTIQAAWKKVVATPWQSFFSPIWYDPYIDQFQQAAAIFFVILSVAAFIVLRKKIYALYAVLLIIIPPFSGTLASMARYGMVAFPLFMALAYFGKNKSIDRIVQVVFLLMQGLLMAAWCQYYSIF